MTGKQKHTGIRQAYSVADSLYEKDPFPHYRHPSDEDIERLKEVYSGLSEKDRSKLTYYLSHKWQMSLRSLSGITGLNEEKIRVVLGSVFKEKCLKKETCPYQEQLSPSRYPLEFKFPDEWDYLEIVEAIEERFIGNVDFDGREYQDRSRYVVLDSKKVSFNIEILPERRLVRVLANENSKAKIPDRSIDDFCRAMSEVFGCEYKWKG